VRLSNFGRQFRAQLLAMCRLLEEGVAQVSGPIEAGIIHRSYRPLSVDVSWVSSLRASITPRAPLASACAHIHAGTVSGR
jgi:hypothetical protein